LIDKKIEIRIIKFGRYKKASTFALPIKRVAIKRLKDL